MAPGHVEDINLGESHPSAPHDDAQSEQAPPNDRNGDEGAEVQPMALGHVEDIKIGRSEQSSPNADPQSEQAPPNDHDGDEGVEVPAVSCSGSPKAASFLQEGREHFPIPSLCLCPHLLKGILLFREHCLPPPFCLLGNEGLDRCHFLATAALQQVDAMLEHKDVEGLPLWDHWLLACPPTHHRI